MSSSAEHLKEIIRDRQEWESFAWKPQLLSWAVMVFLLTLMRWLVPALWVLEVGFFALGALLQVFWSVRQARKSPRQDLAVVNAFWGFAMALGLTVGTIFPWAGLFTPLAGGVLQNFFLASALFLLGSYKNRRSLCAGSFALILAALLWAIFPQAQSLIPLSVLVGAVVPALFLKSGV